MAWTLLPFLHILVHFCWCLTYSYQIYIQLYFMIYLTDSSHIDKSNKKIRATRGGQHQTWSFCWPMLLAYINAGKFIMIQWQCRTGKTSVSTGWGKVVSLQELGRKACVMTLICLKATKNLIFWISRNQWQWWEEKWMWHKHRYEKTALFLSLAGVRNQFFSVNW